MRRIFVTLFAAGVGCLAASPLARADDGELNVTGTPPGTAISVTGPGGFSARGELPFSVRRLASGKYRIAASHEGYADAVVSARVRAGRTVSVQVALEIAPLSPIGGAVGPASGGLGIGHTRSHAMPALSIPGTLTSHEIGPIVKAHLGEINVCYQNEHAHDPRLAGKVTVHWVIGGKGTVTEAEVTESELHNGDVETCMLKIIRALKFPPPKGGGIVTVNYPFHFEAE